MNKSVNELFMEVLDMLGFSVDKITEGSYALWDKQLESYRRDGDGEKVVAVRDAGEALEKLSTYVGNALCGDLEDGWDASGLQGGYDMPTDVGGWAQLAEQLMSCHGKAEQDFLLKYKDTFAYCDLVTSQHGKVSLEEVNFWNYCERVHRMPNLLGGGECYVTFGFPCAGVRIEYEKDGEYDREKDAGLCNIVTLHFWYKEKNIGTSLDEHVDDLDLQAIRDGSYTNLVDEDRTLGEIIAQHDRDCSEKIGVCQKS